MGREGQGGKGRGRDVGFVTISDGHIFWMLVGSFQAMEKVIGRVTTLRLGA